MHRITLKIKGELKKEQIKVTNANEGHVKLCIILSNFSLDA